VFYNFDQLGFIANSQWFEALAPPQISCLRFHLETIWRRRVAAHQREKIVPGIGAANNGQLFRGTLFPGIDGAAATAAAEALAVIEKLITASPDKTQRTVGALYSLTALTTVSPGAREAYPWLSFE
jgi:hypothetical protein